MKDVNKVKDPKQKTTAIRNARERYKIVTLPLEQSNINKQAHLNFTHWIYRRTA